MDGGPQAAPPATTPPTPWIMDEVAHQTMHTEVGRMLELVERFINGETISDADWQYVAPALAPAPATSSAPAPAGPQKLRPVPDGAQTVDRDVTLRWARGGPVRMIVNID